MRLADFIASNAEPILAEWVAFAATCGPAGQEMDVTALRDHARRSSPQHGPGDWVERVAHLRGTLLRRDDFDDVPIKPPRVFREINQSFGPDTTFVTAIG